MTPPMGKPAGRLAALAESLRAGRMPLADYHGQLRETFDKWNPRVIAFLEEQPDRWERLAREAARLEARFPDPTSRPPLYGVAIGVKDIFGVAGMPTRAGCRLPAELFAGPEAAGVTALKRAGALVLGKTVTTEFAYFAAGPTRNPYNAAHTPGGSSSGSAAAVAAGMCPLALGSQTIGSIIRPAAFCGVVGFKPTYGRVPIKGVLPISSALDHVGFFTPDVKSAALAASVLVEGWDRRSAAATPAAPVLGVPEGPYLERTSVEGLEHFRGTCRKLEVAGFEVRSVPAMDDFDEIVERHLNLMAAEMAEVHKDWFARYRDLYHAKTAALIEKGQKVSVAQVEAGRTGREKFREEIVRLLDEHKLTDQDKLTDGHKLSGLIAPSAVGPAPEGLESTGDPIMNLPWTYAGLPVVNVPSGLARNGLPLGLQVVGRWMGDEALLSLSARVAEILGPLPPS